MDVIALLQFGDNINEIYNVEYRVVSCSTHYVRGYNSLHPTTTPFCHSIDIKLIAPKKDDLELQNWFLQGTLRTGRIFCTTWKDQGGSCARSIFFEDAACYSLIENYDIHDNNLRTLTLKIVPKKSIIENVIF